ncbi:MFS transporter [Kibdelosporangium phytohabitans]|uniref:MFS transporter n=1 Tax=Kibdelosporangium phytohabitans TaxID=860235 RepID=UPI000AAF75ED|nr:MFS transporter [Kibdelosporangium phytohabitans]MBE1464915.1 MFS family permease [Kibdelosporangium phytohabitans]
MEWRGTAGDRVRACGKTGLYSSFVQLGVPIGVVLANTVFLLSVQLAGSGFASWGWRIPFLVGVLVLVLAWYIHVRVEETPEFRAAEAKSADAEVRASPLRVVLREHLGTVLLAAARSR